MIKLTLKDGSVREIEAAAPAGEIVKGIGMGLYKAACCVKINGEVKDLRTIIDSDCEFEVCTFDTLDGKKTFWHTASHILAQAVKRLYPSAKLAIGPAIDSGFYYDFDLEKPFTPEELEKIEAEMKKIVKEDLALEQFQLSPEEAIAKLKEMEEPYKVELCEEHVSNGEPISFYKQGEFTDLCAGPHLMSTAPVKAFKLLSCTGAYWRGSEKNKMLSRVYAIAFPKASMLDEYLKMIEEAKLRDHKKLGKELSLFMFDPTAPGMPYWLPRGWKLFNALLEYWRGVHEDHGYTEISGPVLSKKELWVTSGHWDHYQDGMFVIPSEEDSEVYCAKPMNCPNAIKVYMNRKRSYKELPLKFNQVDVIHRKEKSGELNGLFRVQQFRQDDAHILVTEEQIASEINDIMDIATEMYDTFGLSYKAELSTRPEDYMGDIEVWNKAEADLKAILEEKYGPDGYELNEGDGAFYGPKIDLKMKDAIGREWQMGTIQLDFQLPLNFQMKYIAPDGSEKQPVMIHRAIFGSFERFIGIITENFTGAFPFWLSPMQVGIVPIRTEHNEYAKKVAALLKKNHIRAEADYTDDNMKNKIRKFKDMKDPYVVIIGDSEAENEQVSINIRGNKQLKNVPLDKFIEMCRTMNEEHTLDVIDTL
ncbi:MAG: threonine--tRNA ligase [Ruminococcus sp.]|nr:threonine--tRNA ligase [Ruminococcus sp.]